MTNYTFDHFTIDGMKVVQNPTTFAMNKDINAVAVYAIEMGTVTFGGVVSAQAVVGEIVTVVVTRPDGSKVSVTDATDANKAFSVPFTDVAGSYSAVATIPASEDANNRYSAASSPSVPFTLDKNTVTRTITLTVS